MIHAWFMMEGPTQKAQDENARPEDETGAHLEASQNIAGSHFLGDESHNTSANPSASPRARWVGSGLTVSVDGKRSSRPPASKLISILTPLLSS